MKTITALTVLCVSTAAAFAEETLLESGSPMVYLANRADPGIGLRWTGAGFDAAGWAPGAYGVGYEAETGALSLIETPVPAGAYSVYTRSVFQVSDPAQVRNLFLGADHDDGYAAWLNGVEIFRSPQMPATALAWNTPAGLHESSNGRAPTYAPMNDISARALPALIAGSNVLAIGVWNNAPSSSDLVLVPRLVRDMGATVTRGPYLQMGTSRSVVVRWRTSLPTDSLVRWGLSPASLVYAAHRPDFTTEHEVELQGLESGAWYHYAVGSSGGILSAGDDHRFLTAPPAGVSRPFRIWALGDSGTADAGARAVRDAYLSAVGSLHTDLWLMLGDNAYPDGTDEDYQAAVFDMYRRMLRTSVLWPTLGNHDGRSADSNAGSGAYYEMFTLPRAAEAGGVASGTEAYYSFDFADAHFICLESYETDRSASGAMLTWLREDLAATTQDWVIAFWHHPPYSKGSHDSDTEIELVEMRRNALPILEEGGVDLVLSGHSHSYERSYLLDGHYGSSTTFRGVHKKDGGSGREDGTGAYRKPAGTESHRGAVYVVAGSSGKRSGGALNHPAMFISLDVLGSVVLELDGDRLDVGFLDPSGAWRDHFTIIKEPGSPPGSGPVDRTASGEIAAAGTVSGSFLDTRAADGVYESIEEIESTSRRRFSHLEHRWTVDILPGTSHTLFLKAFRTASTDGDLFRFAYSTDDRTYTDLLTVSRTRDDGTYQTASLPPSLSGRIYLRVRDTNRAPRARPRDTVHVDHLFIRTE